LQADFFRRCVSNAVAVVIDKTADDSKIKRTILVLSYFMADCAIDPRLSERVKGKHQLVWWQDCPESAEGDFPFLGQLFDIFTLELELLVKIFQSRMELVDQFLVTPRFSLLFLTTDLKFFGSMIE